MNDYLKAQIEEHCQMVQRGAKPMSLLPIQTRYSFEAKSIIKQNKLHFYFEDNGEGWQTIFIFKNKEIIRLLEHLPRTPKTAIEHAFIGFLLGYDINSICEYITKNILN